MILYNNIFVDFRTSSHIDLYIWEMYDTEDRQLIGTQCVSRNVHETV